MVLTQVGGIHCDRQYRRSTTRSDYETLSELFLHGRGERRGRENKG